MENLYARGLRAAITFLEKRGYEIVDKVVSENIDAVAYDDDQLVFIRIRVVDEMSETDSEKQLRGVLEKEAFDYLDKTGTEITGRIRFDTIEMVVMGDMNHAFLRHHIDCLA